MVNNTLTSRVVFVRQENPERLPDLCRLTDHYFSSGKRVLVRVEDENQAVSLDRFLWTCDRHSFLPHVFANGSVQCFNEPIVITVDENNPNASNVLIMGALCTLKFMSQFDLVVDFAELYDPLAAEQSRERFRHYRRQGFRPEMFEL